MPLKRGIFCWVSAIIDFMSSVVIGCSVHLLEVHSVTEALCCLWFYLNGTGMDFIEPLLRQREEAHSQWPRVRFQCWNRDRQHWHGLWEDGKLGGTCSLRRCSGCHRDKWKCIQVCWQALLCLGIERQKIWDYSKFHLHSGPWSSGNHAYAGKEWCRFPRSKLHTNVRNHYRCKFSEWCGIQLVGSQRQAYLRGRVCSQQMVCRQGQHPVGKPRYWSSKPRSIRSE